MPHCYILKTGYRSLLRGSTARATGSATLLMFFVDRPSAIEHCVILLRVAKSVANVAHVPENAPLLYSSNWITVTFEGVHSTSYEFSHPFAGFC